MSFTCSFCFTGAILLDVSDGHNILNAFRATNKDPLDIQRIFISHYDSDHILGIIPLVRTFRNDPERRAKIVYCSKEVMSAIDSLFAYTARHQYIDARQHVQFQIVADDTQTTIGSWKLRFFSIESAKRPNLAVR